MSDSLHVLGSVVIASAIVGFISLFLYAFCTGLLDGDK